jgi:flagellar protein FliS
MAISNCGNALKQYRQVNTESAVAYASPHRLIQMLMEGAMDSLTRAKGHIERGEVIAKGEQISKAIGIIGGLREGLNLEAGGELAANLDSLYDYMQRQLVQSNCQSDSLLIEQVAGLLRPVKEAWDVIGVPTDKAAEAAGAPV